MREASTLQAGRMDKMETEAAGARSTRHLRRRPEMVGLAAGAVCGISWNFSSHSVVEGL